MPEHTRCIRPLLGINFQARVEEVEEAWGEILGIVDLRRAVCCNEVEGTERVLVEVGRFAFHHFNAHNAERPDVHLWVRKGEGGMNVSGLAISLASRLPW